MCHNHPTITALQLKYQFISILIAFSALTLLAVCQKDHPSSLASLKSRMVLPFWCWLMHNVLEKRPLNRCLSISTCMHQYLHKLLLKLPSLTAIVHFMFYVTAMATAFHIYTPTHTHMHSHSKINPIIKYINQFTCGSTNQTPPCQPINQSQKLH